MSLRSPFAAEDAAEVAFVMARPGPPPPAPLPEERAVLSASATAQRVVEFARGRHCARQAMAVLGWPNAQAQAILRQGPRAPRWPEALVGALTHSRGWVAAAVTHATHCLGLGLDLETIRRPTPTLIRRIARSEERDWLGAVSQHACPAQQASLSSRKQLPQPDSCASPAELLSRVSPVQQPASRPQHAGNGPKAASPGGALSVMEPVFVMEPVLELAFTLLFSAKESIYKALNPATGTYLGYQDAHVWIEGLMAEAVEGPAKEQAKGLGAAPSGALTNGPVAAHALNGSTLAAGGTWRWELCIPAGAAFPAGYQGVGRWSQDGTRVLTGTAVWRS